MSDAVTAVEIPSGKWLGARVRRVEDPRYLSGQARYLADLTLPRMLHAAFVRSTSPHAIIRSIDTSGAATAPGVIGVFTGLDVETHPLVDFIRVEGLLKTPQPALPVERTHFVGQAVAVVLAESRGLAEDAADLVAVDYEPLDVVADVHQSLADGTPILHPELGTNVLFHEREVFGDVEPAFAAADRIFKRSYHTNRVSAAPMECRGCLADYQSATGELTVWSSTQTPHLLQLSIADLLEVPHPKVRVIAPDVGGGFGQKLATNPEELVVPYLARLLGRPVKWVEDRRENLIAAGHAKEEVIDLEAAIGSDGRLLAIRARFIGDAGAFSHNSTSALIEPRLAAKALPSVYDLQNYEYELYSVLTNKAPITSYRAVGWTSIQIARDALFEEISQDLEIDPAAFRRKNMIAPDAFPYQACTSQLYDSGSYRESLDLSLEEAGYDQLRREQADLREKGRYLGIGVSAYVEASGLGSEASWQSSGFPFASLDNATVTVDPTGEVTVSVSVPSQGQGHKTAFAQLVADALGVSVENVEVVQGDTASSPWGLGTWGSRSAVVAGGCLALASSDVRAKILNVASKLLEAAAPDLRIEDSRVHVAGSPDRGVDFAEVANAVYFRTEYRDGDSDPSLTSTRFYDPKASYSNGCILAVVEVDVETGMVDVRSVTAVEDCGTVINPAIVEGQVRGAVAQGIGLALLEHASYDEDAQPTASTLMDYLLPTATDVPPITVAHLASPSPHTIGGIKGMGEGGLIAAPAAVICAVLDALAPFQPRIDGFPLTPERVARLAGTVR